MDSIFNEVFTDSYKALKHIESIRWRNGRFCPKCGERERTSPTASKNHRPGLYYCNSCKKTFTVTVGTIFHGSHIPLNKWLYVFYAMCFKKKGVSALELSDDLNIRYQTVWFMCHRVRKAMKTEHSHKLGGKGKIVEIDETYWGNNGKQKAGARGWHHKMKIISLTERNGEKRSFLVENTDAKTIHPILIANIHKDTRIITDESKIYKGIDKYFKSHETVNHSIKEYARGDVTTNTVESSFAVLKRKFRGTHHYISKQHLKRYLDEVDFAWNHRKNTKYQKIRAALIGIEGKRLTYWELTKSHPKPTPEPKCTPAIVKSRKSSK